MQHGGGQLQAAAYPGRAADGAGCGAPCVAGLPGTGWPTTRPLARSQPLAPQTAATHTPQPRGEGDAQEAEKPSGGADSPGQEKSSHVRAGGSGVGDGVGESETTN